MSGRELQVLSFILKLKCKFYIKENLKQVHTKDNIFMLCLFSIFQYIKH